MAPWTYRLICLALFLAVMAGIRFGVQALKDMHNTPLMALVCLPIVAACIAFGFWYDRRGY